MPDSYPPNTAETGDYLPIRPLEGQPDHIMRRKWWCPGDQTIATYADGVLRKHRRAWVEFHLSGCLRCRLLVADALKAERESDVASVPVHLIQKAKGLAVRPRARGLRLWVPAGALAASALLITITIVARKPGPTIAQPVPAAAVAPQVATSEPPPSIRPSVPDVVRNGQIRAFVPTLLSPQAGSVMSSDQIKFSWKAIPRSRNYEVQIVKADGDLIWKGETVQSALQLPSDIALQDGSYFVWVTASLDDGQRMKSSPVRFQVRRPY